MASLPSITGNKCDSMTDQAGDDVARTVLAQFNRLPKKGKPTIKGNGHREWTVLAGITLSNSANPNQQLECVALGTGLKCLPKIHMNHCGTAVNDSHAEVVCRRNLQRYLMLQVINCIQGKASALEPSTDAQMKEDHMPFRLRQGLEFHMYASQSPCGDASMHALDIATSHNLMPHDDDRSRLQGHCDRKPNAGSINNQDTLHQTTKRDLTDIYSPDSLPEMGTTQKYKRKHDDAAAMVSQPKSTGKGSCKTNAYVSTEVVLRGRTDFSSFGRLRTKPGRPDAPPTLCMSCSDKIAKWNAIGLSGALVSLLIPPIHISSLVVGDLFDKAALQSSLVDRVKCSRLIRFKQTTEQFEWAQSSGSISADAALSWCAGEPPEAIVQGRKQGAGKKGGVWLPNSYARICKAETGKLFMTVLHHCPEEIRTQILERAECNGPDGVIYRKLKSSAIAYQQTKSDLYCSGGALEGWIVNEPTLEDFVVASDIPI
ncbi:hypothetical protein BASA50_002083 [Batrachochytrium salamandrivorans]|uniref:A to I editase domain-containing protein n=1 Tax=Batrachochytrium salamandrivorans TaxID=1357716 RepID=A0ABQ8FQ96_9FUNG|nr:hypothetical protein BASA50_002083 [Batrachochytrium salamandrivorans]